MTSNEALRVRRDNEWASMVRHLEASESWVNSGLLPVARIARTHPRFQLLFPFLSLNQLCFSRCSDGPYTNDCPCIGVDRRGVYGVTAFPYFLGSPDEDPRPELALPTDANHAIEIAAAALPPDADDVWLGTASDRPAK
jgi:hypothetical protein